MKRVNILPWLPAHKSCSPNDWLYWPGMDTNPHGYEFSGVGIRERIFGIDRYIQEYVAIKVFHKIRLPLAGTFQIRDKNGTVLANINRPLHYEIIIKLERNDDPSNNSDLSQ